MLRFATRRIAPLAILLFASASLAQAAVSGSIYRLDKGSDHTEGCLPPCKCPIALLGDMRGTFTLTPIVISQFSQQYAVENVNWTVVSLNGDETKVLGGNGVYTRTSGFAGVQQQLTLELSIDGGPVAKFDSGVVAGSSFPTIDLEIADNDFNCYNRIFHVRASPVPAGDVTYYNLGGTTYQEGCFPPCLCPLLVPRKVAGKFALVLLEKDAFVTRYSVVDLGGYIQGPTFGSNLRRIPFDGNGDYSIIMGLGPLPAQSMTLYLEIDGVTEAPFTSGNVFGLVPFGQIQLTLSQNGMVCFDKVFELQANAQTVLPGVFLPAIR
jgi:hypothetical protein